MTAYLLQSLIFFVVFSVVSAVELPVSETANVLFAVATWLLSAALCVVLALGGRQGPFERLLRSAVAWSERKGRARSAERAPSEPVAQGVPARSVGHAVEAMQPTY